MYVETWLKSHHSWLQTPLCCFTHKHSALLTPTNLEEQVLPIMDCPSIPKLATLSLTWTHYHSPNFHYKSTLELEVWQIYFQVIPNLIVGNYWPWLRILVLFLPGLYSESNILLFQKTFCFKNFGLNMACPMTLKDKLIF